MAIKITKKMLTNNDCYKQGKTIKPTGIVVHSTGCNQTNAEVFIKSWNRSGIEKAVHAFIDANGIYQTLPFTMRCWGCGKGSKGSYNNSHIQFEICEDNLKSKEYFNNVYNKAVELCAYLCTKYNINPLNIVCHSEAHKLGYASNHADVMHWFPKHSKSMDIFRSDVLTILTPTKTVTAKSNKIDIYWLQIKLNQVAKANLTVDGVYGSKTQQAVLNYWKQLNWNKDGKDDGTRAGAKTIAALASGRVK